MKKFEHDLFGSKRFGVDVHDILLVICSEEELTRSISSKQFRTLCPGTRTQSNLDSEPFFREVPGEKSAKESLFQREVVPSQQFTDGESGPSAKVDEEGDGSHKISRRALEQLLHFRAYPSSTSSSLVPDKQIKAPDDLYLLTVSTFRTKVKKLWGEQDWPTYAVGNAYKIVSLTGRTATLR